MIETYTYVLYNGVVTITSDIEVHRIKSILDSFMLMCSGNNFLIDNLDLTYEKLSVRKIFIEEDLKIATENLDLSLSILKLTAGIGMHIFEESKDSESKVLYRIQFQQISNWKEEGF